MPIATPRNAWPVPLRTIRHKQHRLGHSSTVITLEMYVNKRQRAEGQEQREKERETFLYDAIGGGGEETGKQSMKFQILAWFASLTPWHVVRLAVKCCCAIGVLPSLRVSSPLVRVRLQVLMNSPKHSMNTIQGGRGSVVGSLKNPLMG